jgi:3-dehydroquinate synthase
MTFSFSYQTEFNSHTNCIQFEQWSELIAIIHADHHETIWVIEEHVALLNTIPLDSFDKKIIIPSGEMSKSFDSVEFLITKLSEYQADKKSNLAVIGGGATSDLVGFVASIYHRGISYTIIPTTLLSIVDASVGGKNGINFGAAKNQIGTVYQPYLIGIHLPFIDSLPREELISGFAEILKYGFILDNQFIQYLESITLDEFISNMDVKSKIIKACMEYKSNIVCDDPFEKNRRKILNFGHTVGHAIESIYNIRHGEAIAIGMLIAIKISEMEVQADTSMFVRAKNLFHKFELPVHFDFDPELVHRKLLKDKKKNQDSIDYILLRNFGAPEILTISTDKLKAYIHLAKNDLWI